ncbi:MAG: TonB-dependent receptor [Prolixibacteraceae bacterium]|nr:TonB-dependent receptor [Prolixibacteraceae bacterium]
MFTLILLLAAHILHAQELWHSIYGTVTDQHTGENLAGAIILIENATHSGTVTNSYGYYSTLVPEGQYKLRIQFMGYDSKEFYVTVHENKLVNISLAEKPVQLDNITIRGEKPDRNVSSIEMGNARLSPKQIESVPVLFGEPDILKTIQLMPGVKSAGEGNSGFFVRGGGIDQNLILLDEAPVYNASHLLGFFSVFNSEAIRDANLMKGLIPAEYGCRASSVLDIKMKEGNLKDYSINGSIGLISSNLTLEGPIKEEKSSFMLSGRRTYADLFLKLSGDEELKNTTLYFYDLNLKTNFRLNERNRLYLSGYFGRDNFGFSDRFGFDWGSKTGTIRWNHFFSERLFLNSSFIYSDYSYDIKLLGTSDVTMRSEIRDINLKEDFTFYKNSRNTLKFGINLIYHNFVPGEIIPGKNSVYNSLKISDRKAVESAAYFSGNRVINQRFQFYYGLRVALFTNTGPGDFYVLDSEGEVRDTVTYSKFKLVKTQGGPEPRLGFNYRLNRSSSIKGSATRIYQFIHLLSNSTTSTPTDVWLPSSDNVKPQIADQFSLGLFKNFGKNRYESSLEGYYKHLYNQIDYKNGADLIFNSTVESELVFGKGWSYGAEFLLKKNYGRLNGWIAYTWSKTMRQFDDINNGRPFPVRHDRTHDLSVVGMYKLSEKVTISANWVYSTGDAVTFPSGRYEIDGQVVGYYTERNGYRMPATHRLDLGVTCIRKKTQKFESAWNFSVYNAYAHENPYYIYFQEAEDRPGTQEAVQVSLFKIIPSVSYKFKF